MLQNHSLTSSAWSPTMLKLCQKNTSEGGSCWDPQEACKALVQSSAEYEWQPLLLSQ